MLLTLDSLDGLDRVPMLTTGTLPVEPARRKTAVQALVYGPIGEELTGQVFQDGNVGALLGVSLLQFKLQQSIQTPIEVGIGAL
jgi:hypothetical protein